LALTAGAGAATAQAAPGVSVASLSSLSGGATAATLHGSVANATGRAAAAKVTVRLLRRGVKRHVVGTTAVRVGAHGSSGYDVAVRIPSGLPRGTYYLAACTQYGGRAGVYGCATAQREVAIGGGTPVRGPGVRAAAAAAPAETCSAGGRTLSTPGARIYPEMGNTGYTSVHTDVYTVYDAVANLFLAGNHVDLTQRATQCLSEFSVDFERTNTNALGPNMTVDSVLIDGQPASFRFAQPTYPGDPNGPDDPDPRAHAASLTNPVGGSAANPLPPACNPTGTGAALQGAQCPANKLVITPSAPIASGATFKVTINYTGRPGVHVDGDGSTEGWFRNNTPAGDGGFVTTEPVGTMAWMPLNNHPTAKPTYDFYDTVTLGRTAIGNGVLVSQGTNPADANFPGGSSSWHWHSPEPIASYLVENSVGNYELTERLASSGVLYYQAQASAIADTRKASNKLIMDQQEDITTFQESFNGRFPFSSDGIVIGLPSASFEEEMQTKITFNGGSIGSTASTFSHENMHQWWGDNVSEGAYNLTFLKEGFASTAEYYFSARNAATAAGGLGTAAGDAAFEASLAGSFSRYYNSTSASYWTVAPSNPTAASLFSNSNTYSRPGIAYLALRQILGHDRYNSAIQELQHTYGGGSIQEAQEIAAFHKWMPNQSAECSAKLDQFFTQWWDTAYPAGGGVNRPSITGPGLDGQGFYDADGGCSNVGVGTIGGSVGSTLSLTLGGAASFGQFTPGLAKDYSATTTATVTSTAGDATLSVADPSATAPGHLVNGAFSLPQPLRAGASSPVAGTGAGGTVSGAPLTLLSWATPVTSDLATVTLTQSIGAADALRTGDYAKTLTFTLTTTTP